jgi:4-hydroxy-tetrahydrodipicolinate reductase
MLKTGICGISGRMGLSILRVLLERGHSLTAAFDAPNAPCAGRPVSSLMQGPGLDLAVGVINEKDIYGVDVLVDFSSPAATMSLVPLARRAGKPLVIGTTGFTPEQRAEIEKAAADIPLLLSPNMSLGVNLLFKLTEIAARALSQGFDVEVFEAHHRFKKDAPSGTAKRLLEVIKQASAELPGAPEVYDRSGVIAERSDREIGVMTMRGGDIVGEHTVYFVGMGERIELTHRATSREVLARGAVQAIEFIASRKAGSYSMFDVVGL